jgi:hypothetical protein
MIRGGSRSGRIACLLVGVSAALAAAVPAAASAQPAVDEYTLDIPGGGGGGDSAGGSAGVASASGGGAGGAGSSERGAESARGGAEGTASGGGGAEGGEEIGSSPDDSGSTGAGGSLDTNDRSAPEVVADTLFDSAMLPILVALVLITGVGAWRLLRHRRTLSGQAS